MMKSFGPSISFRGVSSPSSPKACKIIDSIASPRLTRPSLIARWFRIFVVIGTLVSFSAAVAVYFSVLPGISHLFLGYGVHVSDGFPGSCDVFDGGWVVDETYPLYNASECPFVEQGFNCLANGRRDENYLKWRWKPRSCEIPRVNVRSVLELLRSKRVVFVGDSMSRTQWESLICLLMTGVEDKGSVYEVNGNNITKQIRFLGVRFSSFNFTIEFYRSVFLVQHNWGIKRGPKRVRSALKLDKLDEISKEWIDSDVLIFNSGQWWVPGKLFGTGCYFQVRSSLKLGMSIDTAYSTALHTWASWVNTHIRPNKTRVFFRTFEPSHWRNLTMRLCNVTHHPLSEPGGKDRSEFSNTVLDVVKNMKVPVTVLHITPMSALRSDAHVGYWSDNSSLSDCSHWCLPGVPDVWNEIVLSYLFANHGDYQCRNLVTIIHLGRVIYSPPEAANGCFDLVILKNNFEGKCTVTIEH